MIYICRTDEHEPIDWESYSDKLSKKHLDLRRLLWVLYDSFCKWYTTSFVSFIRVLLYVFYNFFFKSYTTVQQVLFHSSKPYTAFFSLIRLLQILYDLFCEFYKTFCEFFKSYTAFFQFPITFLCVSYDSFIESNKTPFLILNEVFCKSFLTFFYFFCKFYKIPSVSLIRCLL